MIPFLTYPLALLALAAVPALAAIYILRNRFRRRQVSSLLLWQFTVQSKEGGAKVHRLQLPLLFFLELLTLLLLVLAASAPNWKLPQATRPLIVVLDDSFSMRAVRDNQSVQQRAREALEKLFRSQPPPSTRLVLAGKEPRLLGAPVKTWSEVSALLAQWNCWSPSSSLAAAVALAAELGRQQANILVLTDHAPADGKVAGDKLQWRAFGAPLANVAFVNASRTALGDTDRCLLEVANFSDTAHTTKLLVQTSSNAVQSSLLTLAPHGQQRVVFNLPAATPLLRAALEPDALAEDNEAQLLPPIHKRIRVQVALTSPALTELANRTLDATGLRAKLDADPQLVIHQSDTITGTNCWSLNWLAASNATAFTGPFIVDTSHPLAEGIALPGVVWAAAALTNAPGDVPVILAGNTPLLTVREDAAGRRLLKLNLNPELSTLTATPDWPILFWNILQWRTSELPGLRESNARLGAEVILKTTGEPVTVTQPDAVQKVFPKTADQLAIETPLPGIYSVTMGATTNAFAVNPLAAEESDLSGRVTGQWGKWSAENETRYAESSVAWLFALAALALLVAHLYLIAKQRGGAR
jgi:hypothetical protein